MTHSDGGFYSALDADSEGEEGRFYTWTYAELKAVLGDSTAVFARYFQVTEEGNWEHGRNILLHDETELPADVKAQKEKLLAFRNNRIRPGLDDKILTGWNAMMIKGLTDAYGAFGENEFLDLAEKNIQFLETNLIHDGRVYRSFKNKRASTEGFLEDYACLIGAYVSLYQCTFNESYINQSQHMV